MFYAYAQRFWKRPASGWLYISKKRGLLRSKESLHALNDLKSLNIWLIAHYLKKFWGYLKVKGMLEISFQIVHVIFFIHGQRQAAHNWIAQISCKVRNVYLISL